MNLIVAALMRLPQLKRLEMHVMRHANDLGDLTAIEHTLRTSLLQLDAIVFNDMRSSGMPRHQRRLRDLIDNRTCHARVAARRVHVSLVVDVVDRIEPTHHDHSISDTQHARLATALAAVVAVCQRRRNTAACIRTDDVIASIAFGVDGSTAGGGRLQRRMHLGE